MGMHRDGDEDADDSVVSLSPGDSYVFRFANVESRRRAYVDVELRGGDLFDFGGPAPRVPRGAACRARQRPPTTRAGRAVRPRPAVTVSGRRISAA
jgi:DNA oxidative demethylase